MLNVRAERSLLFKVMLGWIYLSFFCVQLHLKYVVAFDAIGRSGSCAVKKQHAGLQFEPSKSQPVKIKLNKRYQPEPFYALPSWQAPLPPSPVFFISFQDNISTAIPGGFSLLLSLRGPPAC